MDVPPEAFINSPDVFFHYEPLFTSSFSKNLIISEAVMFSKSKVLLFFINIPVNETLTKCRNNGTGCIG